MTERYSLTGPELRPDAVEQRRRAADAQIVDVRSGGEFAAGRIPGARLIPLAELACRHPEIDRNVPLILVCQTGQRSRTARERLLALGFSHICTLEGGMSAWCRAQLPVEKDARAPWALERQVRVAAGSLVLLGAALGWLVHPGFFGLSAFVGAGLVFAGVTDWCGMGMLLARAPWNRRST